MPKPSPTGPAAAHRLLLGLAVTLCLALCGCEHVFARGTVTEHGPRNVRVGVPL